MTTPQELAALPVGARIKFDLRHSLEDEKGSAGYDYGTISAAGNNVQIRWDDGFPSTSIIDTAAKSWETFIGEISLDTDQKS